MADPQDRPRKWHIDHSIPIALICAFVAQTLIGTWWISSFASTTSQRLETIESRQKAMDVLPERLARQEAQLDAVLSAVKSVKEDMRDLANRSRK